MPIVRQLAQMGHPVLRRVAERIADPALPALRALVDDMLVTVADANGVGLAAPQVYEACRMIIIASRPNPRYPHAPEMEPTVMVNPELLRSSDEREHGWEGCLSIPGMRGLVSRYRKVGVRYQTREGVVREAEYEGFLARVFQHELDHLNGVLYVDRLESMLDLVTEKEYARQQQGGS